MPGLMEIKKQQWAKEKEELNGLWSPWGRPDPANSSMPSMINSSEATSESASRAAPCQLPPISNGNNVESNGVWQSNGHESKGGIEKDEDTSGYHSSGNESRYGSGPRQLHPPPLPNTSTTSPILSNVSGIGMWTSSQEQNIFDPKKTPIICRDLSPGRTPRTKQPKKPGRSSEKVTESPRKSPTHANYGSRSSLQSGSGGEYAKVPDDSIYTSTNYVGVHSKTPPAAMRSSFAIGEEGPIPNAHKEVVNKEREQWLNELEKQREEQRLRKELEREEKRPKWGDRGIGVGNFWEPSAQPLDRDENFNVTGSQMNINGGGGNGSGDVKAPAWLEKGLSRLEGIQPGKNNGVGPLLESPNCSFFGLGIENSVEVLEALDAGGGGGVGWPKEVDQHPNQNQLRSFTISDDGGFLRGQKALLDQEYSVEREKRRLAGLEHQELIRKQMEERQSRVREMRQKREERSFVSQQSNGGSKYKSTFPKGRSGSESDGNGPRKVFQNRKSSSSEEQLTLPPINDHNNSTYNPQSIQNGSGRVQESFIGLFGHSCTTSGPSPDPLQTHMQTEEAPQPRSPRNSAGKRRSRSLESTQDSGTQYDEPNPCPPNQEQHSLIKDTIAYPEITRSCNSLTNNSNNKGTKPRWGVTPAKAQYVKNSEKDPLYKARLAKRMERLKRRENERRGETTGTESDGRVKESASRLSSYSNSNYRERNSRFRKRLEAGISSSSSKGRTTPLKALPPPRGKDSPPFSKYEEENGPKRTPSKLSVEKTFVKPNSAASSRKDDDLDDLFIEDLGGVRSNGSSRSSSRVFGHSPSKNELKSPEDVVNWTEPEATDGEVNARARRSAASDSNLPVKSKGKPRRISKPKIQPPMVFDLDPPEDDKLPRIFTEEDTTPRDALAPPRRMVTSPPVPALLKSLKSTNESGTPEEKIEIVEEIHEKSLVSSLQMEKLTPEEFYDQINGQDLQVEEDGGEEEEDAEEFDGIFKSDAVNEVKEPGDPGEPDIPDEEDANQDPLEDEGDIQVELLDEELNQPPEEEENDEEEYCYSDEFTGESSSGSSLRGSRSPSPSSSQSREPSPPRSSHDPPEDDPEEIKSGNETDFPSVVPTPPHIPPLLDLPPFAPPPPPSSRLPLHYNYSTLDGLHPQFELKRRNVIKLQEISPVQTLKLKEIPRDYFPRFKCTSRKAAVDLTNEYTPPKVTGSRSQRFLKQDEPVSSPRRLESKGSDYSMVERDRIIQYLGTRDELGGGIQEFSVPKSLQKHNEQRRDVKGHPTKDEDELANTNYKDPISSKRNETIRWLYSSEEESSGRKFNKKDKKETLRTQLSILQKGIQVEHEEWREFSSGASTSSATIDLPSSSASSSRSTHKEKMPLFE